MSVQPETTATNPAAHDQQTFTIIVNGRPKHVTQKELTFDEVVVLAFERPPFGDNTIFTVTYRKGEGDKQASLVEGGIVKIKDGMIFNVTATNKS